MSPGPSSAGETACRFVSSRGILTSCDAHARRPRSSHSRIPFGLSRVLRTARVVYLCTDMVPQFVREHVPRRNTPFTLMTGDSDLAVAARCSINATSRRGRRVGSSPDCRSWSWTTGVR